MPAEIPGFVYDAARGRYFRVQENHLNTQHVALRSAPEGGTWSRPGDGVAAADGTGVGARYTREVVEGQKRARDEEKRKKKGKSRRRQRDGDRTAPVEQRRRGGRREAGEIELQLRLRGSVGGKGASVEEMIKQRYATSLSARTVASSVHVAGGAVSAFVVDPDSKELFTGMRLGPDNRPQFCVSPFAEDAATMEGADDCADGAFPAHGRISSGGWDSEKTIPILDTSPLEAVSVVADGCAVWVTQARYHQPGHDDVDGSLMHVSTRYASRGADVPWANWREDFGEWGTRTYNLTDRTLWDVRGNPARDGKLVLATSDGVMIWEMNAEDDFIATGREREAMCVAWMNERLWLAGARNGTVQLGDVRDPAATVARLRHAGAVSAVQGLQPRCDWGLLVWGLEDSAVYDLRWTRPVKEAGHNTRRTSKKSGKAEIPLTRPLLEFEMPESQRQRQYGMGFALDAQAGVVAAAWPALHGNGRVGLWDVTTGRILEGVLKERKFRNYVKSLQFVDLEGRGDGPKSLLIGTTVRTGVDRSKAVIEAWET